MQQDQRDDPMQQRKNAALFFLSSISTAPVKTVNRPQSCLPITQPQEPTFPKTETEKTYTPKQKAAISFLMNIEIRKPENSLEKGGLLNSFELIPDAIPAEEEFANDMQVFITSSQMEQYRIHLEDDRFLDSKILFVTRNGTPLGLVSILPATGSPSLESHF